MAFRQKLYETLNTVGKGSTAARIYNIFMIVLIVVNLSTLIFIDDNMLLHHTSASVQPVIFVFQVINVVTVAVFIADYFLRWITADLYLKKGRKSFFIYPFTVMAILDLLSIIPSLVLAGNGLQLLRGIRILRLLRAVNILKHSRGVLVLSAGIRRVRTPLISVVLFVLVYVLISALVLFSIEPQSFDYNFFNALYWSVMSISAACFTGYIPQSVPGQMLAMISGLIGVVIIALPVSIITAGFMLEITKYYGAAGITDDDEEADGGEERDGETEKADA